MALKANMDLENMDLDVFDYFNVGCFGTPLVEVFNICISKELEVYGTVRIEDREGTLNLFNRAPMNIGPVKANDTLSLTTYDRIIPVSGAITFYVDLKDKYGRESVKGSFILNLMDASMLSLFDKYLLACINGKLGWAKIYYTIPLVAFGATVKFQLTQVDSGMGYLDVKGTIIARYGKNYDKSVAEDVKKYSEFMLYDKTFEDKPLQLKNEDLLPLSRSVVIVSAPSSIVIEMKLVFYGPDGRSEELEWCPIDIPAHKYHSHKQTFNLKCCALKMLVYF